jgi:glutamate 5-kinase
MQSLQATNLAVWKQVYQEAVFELDHGHLKTKIEAARNAIEDRLAQLIKSGGTHREYLELGDAMRTLMYLERSELAA